MMQRVRVVLITAGLSVLASGCVIPLVAGGAAVGAMVATDRRSSGAQLDDKTIELKAADQLNKRFPSAHLNVTSYNRAALITGEVPSNEARQLAEQVVRGIPNVRRVYNYTDVAPAASYSQISNDVWVSSKVRGRLLNGNGFSPNNVKVVTEAGVVYIMGLLTKGEADAAASVVSQTAGVIKVVTLFEYQQDITPLPGAQPSSSPSQPSSSQSQPAPVESDGATTSPLAP